MTIMIILMNLLGIAFLTLYERNILSYIQLRTGPNITGYYGILQPLMDGIKLILKEAILPAKASKIEYILSPAWLFLISLIIWYTLPIDFYLYILNKSLDVTMTFALLAISVLANLFSGYHSHNKYSLLSTSRMTSQLIAYDLVIGTLLLPFVMYSHSLDYYTLYLHSYLWSYACLFLPLLLIYLIAILAELNRPPCDLLEAESELVSGIMTEYSSIEFVFFYLAEYNFILYWSLLSSLLLGLPFLLLLSLFIAIRALLPRMTYASLIGLGWYILIPITLGLLFTYYTIAILFIC